jgi:hypothetical protein
VEEVLVCLVPWFYPVFLEGVGGVSSMLNQVSLVDAWISYNLLLLLSFSLFICMMHMFSSCE